MKKFLFGRAVGVLGMLYLVLALNGCHRPFDNTNNVLKIDTLQQLVVSVDDELLLDENVFRQRDDSMLIKLSLIHSKIKKINDGVTSEAVLRYEGIEKNYENLLRNYPVMEYNESEFHKSVTQMKQKVVTEKISQDDFDKYYEATKPALEKLYTSAKTVTYDNLSIEKDFLRTDPVVTTLYHKVEDVSIKKTKN